MKAFSVLGPATLFLGQALAQEEQQPTTGLISTPIPTTPPTPAQTSEPPATSALASGLPTLEIDVVFPRINTTYNVTDYIPIVFSLQNLRAAADLGPFTFHWGLMKYGSFPVDAEPTRYSPAGTYQDYQEIHIDSSNIGEFENKNGDPFILVNATNVTNWELRIEHWMTNIMTLQWGINWDNFETERGECSGMSDYQRDTAHRSDMQFYLAYTNIDNPFPGEDPGEMIDVEGQCAQFGSLIQISEGHVLGEEGKCPRIERFGEDGGGKPCELRLEGEVVSSISAKALELAAPTETAGGESSSMPESTNLARPTGVPVGGMVVAMGMLGGWQVLGL